MAQLTRTIDLLPEIFRTEPNRKFLSSTLDQLTRNPEFERVQGYIGRVSTPGYKRSDNYVDELTAERTNYQLEPGIVFTGGESSQANDAITYPGMLDALSNSGADVTRHDRLFKAEYAAWDPFIDFDKFSNFNRYYWLPAGPDSVDVAATEIPFTDSIDVSRQELSYELEGLAGNNPVVTLVRGGSYTFELNQPGNPFWIQTEPGTSGVLEESPNRSSRNVLGVSNNGADTGTITFDVPDRNEQSFFYNLESIGTVDLITDIGFDKINNRYVDEFIGEYSGIDGVTDFNNKTIVITQPESSDSWVQTTFFDNANFDTQSWDQTSAITNLSEIKSVWRISVIEGDDGRSYLSLSSEQEVPRLNKFTVEYGAENANRSFYRDAQDQFKEIPFLSAIKDTLYYQDQNNPELFGRIVLIEQDQRGIIDVNDILGREVYTSTNGVEFTNGLKVQFRGIVVPETFQDKQYYVEGVGTGIKLLPVEDFVTPETYTDSEAIRFDQLPFDVGNFEESLNQPQDPDYFTINRASPDLNPWTRSNRWFHEDVIKASARYNNTTPVINNDQKARRPILEFRSGLRLFNFGTRALDTVDIIDLSQTDAFSNVNGSRGYSIDGVGLIDGTRIIFANDNDSRVRDEIYEVSLRDANGDGEEQIILNESISTVGIDDTIIIKSGVRNQGKSFRYDGDSWVPTQQKEKVNQAPLFDIFDENENSFGDQDTYPGSDFVGSKLFSYAIGTGLEDDILEFPLEFLTINNVGDIVFNNNFYTDTFSSVDGRTSKVTAIKSGYVREYDQDQNYQRRIGWQKAIAPVQQKQLFRYVYQTGRDLSLDIPVKQDTIVPAVAITADSEFVSPTNYEVTINSDSTTINFTEEPDSGAVIEVRVLSDKVSNAGFYEIPANLEKNPFNEEAATVTLGTIRNHYQSLVQNNPALRGQINGSNNSRDLGNIIPFGTDIIQHSSSMLPTGAVLRSGRVEFFDALEFNARAYETYKTRIIDIVTNQDFGTDPAWKILDKVVARISSEKSENSAFYWSDMLPSGLDYVDSETVVSEVTSRDFDTVYTYDFENANRQSLMVYVDDRILLKDQDYEVSTDSPSITITASLEVGDRVRIREYTKTNSSFVPNTPTKLGLHPAYKPSKFVDDTFVESANVIQGHDGSITLAYDDVRDDVILEFETRIYNNLKVSTEPPIDETDVIPGKFRSTDYDLETINGILSTEFLTWSGLNRLDYREQTYISDNKFTWNYSTADDVIDDEVLLGHWRGIYEYFYDTDSPHSRPWEMLGLSIKPEWWDSTYGPAPYTENNLILWQDIADGRVRDPSGEYIDESRIRNGLLDVIPVDGHGNLKAPLDNLVDNYNSQDFRKKWVFGDGAPVESAWRRSSTYPFVIQKLIALTRPAKYFATGIDRDRYRFEPEFEQFLFDSRSRLDFTELNTYGQGDPQHSYFNWVADYEKQLGEVDQDCVSDCFSNIDVRLCYRLAGFTDKQYLRLFAENFTPNTQNSSLLVPEESYQLLLYKNEPDARISFSSVIVQVDNNGWTVWGNSSARPYFEITQSIPNGNFSTLTVNETSVRYARDFRSEVTRVPYGYTFKTRDAVVDFLISYGRQLESRGMRFDERSNGIVIDWTQIAREFLYWSQQGWGVGNIINLNPSSEKVSVNRVAGLLEDVSNDPRVLLNQNRRPIKSINYNVNRSGDLTEISVLNEDLIGMAELNFVNYEQLLILDNSSIFADLFYEPASGNRQNRLLLSGSRTTNWAGRPDAPGFIISNPDIPEWEPNKRYARGEIVRFKNQLWSAKELIEPSEEFEYNDWLPSDFDDTRQGLLPNIATKADDALDYYNKNSANLNRDADLLGLGIIGFRPRDYLENLNLDDITQTNLYSNFIATKGTLPTTQLLSAADFGKERADYNVFENWAVKQATYGANGNRSYFEISLDQAALQANPSTISIVDNGDGGIADQTIRFDRLYKESKKFSNKNILPELIKSRPDTDLPSAGYVNRDTVDFQVFSLSDIENQISSEEIGPGTTIWVAKDTEFDWNVYYIGKLNSRIVQVDDNLNGQSRITFSSSHGLVPSDKIIIKSFSAEINGYYEIIDVPNLDTALIEFGFSTRQTQQTGNGVVLTFESARVGQPSDVVDLSYCTSLVSGDRAWVDDSGDGTWQVLEKQEPFDSNTMLIPQIETDQYGTSIAQGFSNSGVLVGAPDGGTDSRGQVFAYILNRDNSYNSAATLSLRTPEIDGYGRSVAAGKSNWGIVGAPDSNANRGYVGVIFKSSPADPQFQQTQLLLDSDSEENDRFGDSVAISDDERWAYVAASGANRIYAYARVDRETQFVTYVGDGTTTEFSYDGNIVIGSENDGDELSVIVNNRLFSRTGGDYVVNTTDNLVSFAAAPSSGETVIIARKEQISLTYRSTADGSKTDFNIASIGGIEASELRVFVGNTEQTLSTDYTISGQTLSFDTAPSSDSVITVFNPSLDQLIGVESHIDSFSVLRNGVLLRANVDYTFNDSANTISFADGDTAIIDSDILVRAKTHFKHVNTIEIPEQSKTYVSHNDTTLTLNNVDGIVPQMVLTGTGFNSGQYVVAVDTENNQVELNSASDSSPSGDIDFALVNFGSSIDTTTDGRQVAIGCIGNDKTPGQVFVFDRVVERFEIDDSSETVYSPRRDSIISSSSIVPVKINQEFLTPSEINSVPQYNLESEYSILTNADIDISDANFEVGDILEVETTEFTKLQTLTAQVLQSGSEFGFSVSQCPTNCSLYIGSPGDSRQVKNGGSAERFVNQPRIYGIATSTNPDAELTAGDTVRINNVDVEVSAVDSHVVAATYNEGDYRKDNGTIYRAIQDVPAGISITDTDYWEESSWAAVFVDDINDADILNIQALLDNRGRVVISAVEPKAQTEFNKLQILPGIGSAFSDIGFEPIRRTQTILPPRIQTSARFGFVVQIDSEADNLVVGSPGARLVTSSTWQTESGLEFDSGATTFFDTVNEAGTVYTFDFLPSSTDNPRTPGKFVFGQQVFVNEISTGDRFGTDVDYINGRLLIGAPDRESDAVFAFNNLGRKPAWQAIDEQATEVDSKLINSVYVYDPDDKRVLRYLDLIDPLQGKILGVARENIDFITPIDPAGYNQGDNVFNASIWREQNVGQIWWDVTNYRLTEYHSNDIVYSSKRWGQGIDGSQVEVYQWIESSVPPSQYDGPGIPKDNDSFTIVGGIVDNQIVANRYYFWVSNTDSVAKSANKTLSLNAIQQYIESPRSSGISYVAPISRNTLGLYNCTDLINRADSVLHVEFDQIETENQVHVEYELIPENRADGFITGQLYKKLLDSLSGADTDGNLVPDVTLPPSELYGIDFRPRQSMFRDREAALQNYLSQVNRILLEYPIAESSDFTRLNSAEPIPLSSSGEWDKKLETTLELEFQNLDIVPIGYRYLVLSDDTVDGLWSIYELNDNRSLDQIRIQTYNTRQYWDFVDWYSEGYSEQTILDRTVKTKSDLFALDPVDGELVRVDNDGTGQWEIYFRENSSWNRVAAQSATIQIDLTIADNAVGRFGFDNEVFDAQFFDERPVRETREIIEAINDDLLVNGLGIERNRALILLFNYIFSEQTTPEWLEKTSLVDVDHTVRSLEPFRVYQQDNQTFVSDYINEVKPYHVKIRQFNLKYQGEELYRGDITDFDLPAEWNLERDRFISPILDDTGRLSTSSGFASESDKWQDDKYSQWFDNRLLVIDSIDVFSGGSGYSVPPEVIITGDAETEIKARARLNVFGEVSSIEIIDPGSGYTTTPTIEITGGNGTGARVVPIMKTQGPRNALITLRYDRYEYESRVSDWQPNTFYAADDLVRYKNEVYRVTETNDSSILFSGDEFVLENYERVPANELGGLDRTSGYYVPAPRTTGDDLSLLVDGISYPGVQVSAPNFNQNTGYDISAFDVVPFDNIDVGPENEISAEYTADGSTVTYEFGYPDDGLITNVEDITVFVDGVEQDENDDFVLNPVSSDSVASITFESAPSSGLDILVNSIITRPTYSDNILDVSYSSNFTDSFLGTLPAPDYDGSPEDTRSYGIEVNGGKFIDTYASHAPEELVPGSTFDTLDITVSTRVGVDTDGNGHAWRTDTRNVQIESETLSRTFDLPKLVTPTTAVVVTNLTLGATLSVDSYTIDWIDNTITLLSGASTGNIIRLDVFGLGGGNHLYSNVFTSSDIVDDTIEVPVDIDEISEILILVDGQMYENFSFSKSGYYTDIEFLTTVDEDSLISIFVLGETEEQYSYSYPVLQSFNYDGSTRQFELENDLEYSNKSHAIVEVNGFRLRPPNGIHHTADESTLTYAISREDDSIGPDQIGPIDVTVYINDEELDLNTDFILNSSDGGSIRTITLANSPTDGDRISIYVRTLSEYVISAGLLIIRESVELNSGDHITIRTWNDTREQRLQTKVFQGPTGSLSTSIVPFDTQGYDSDKYDEESESVEFTTEYNLGTTGIEASRVWATYDGQRLLPNEDFVIETRDGEDILVLTREVNGAEDIVSVTIFGRQTVPLPLDFKLFDDMRGNQSVYRIINESSTTLAKSLSSDDDVIYVSDVSVLEDPELEQGRFGVLFMNGERITFRERDLTNNTVSGLRRGTAGTGVFEHEFGDIVTDASRANEAKDATSTTWHELGEETILTGGTLQDSQSVIAQFLKGK